MQLVRFLFLVPLLLSFLLSPFSIAPPTAHAAQAEPCVSEWVAVPIAAPPRGTPYLSNISGHAPDDVWAVGDLESDDGTSFKTLVERWDGSVWTIVPSPNVEGRANGLTDVVALSASDVWAFGWSAGQDQVSHLLTLHWDGVEWTIVTSPELASQAQLVSVSGTADEIWAVGSSEGNALILHWNGSEWQSVPSPINLSFRRVIAKATDEVWALGVDADNKATLLRWDGSEWAIATSFQLWYDVQTPPYIHIEGISDFVVPAANDIWVVGTFSDKYSNSRRRWHWDGESWSSSWSSAQDGEVVETPQSGAPKSFAGEAKWGGGIPSIAGLSGDNLWELDVTDQVLHARYLSHRNSTGWRTFDMSDLIPRLSSAGMTAVSDQDFWIVGRGYKGFSYELFSFALHGIFTCHAPPAEQAILVSPAQGEITTELHPTFDWEDVGGTSYYNLEVTHPHDDPTVIEGLPNSEYFWVSTGMRNGEHAWRVQACNYVGCGPWSDPVTWTKQTPAPVAAPQLLSPPSGTSLASDIVTVEWAEVSNTVFYKMELYKGVPLGPPYAFIRTSDEYFAWYSRDLGEGHYYWRVRACNPGGCGPWAGKFEFTIFYPPPPRPVLRIPAARAVLNMRKPLFEWENWETGRITLELRVKSKNGAIVDTVQVGSQGSFRWQHILPNGQYYWRLKACNDHHCSEWSKGRKFFVQK